MASSSSSSSAAGQSAKASGQEEINDLLIALDSYTPTIPEAITKHYMHKSGIAVIDPRMAKLVSLAADKFLSETIHETKQMGTLRRQGLKHTMKRKVAETSDNLEIEDLERYLSNQRYIHG
jgi:transcription initiation factor TFIID subunit 10